MKRVNKKWADLTEFQKEGRRRNNRDYYQRHREERLVSHRESKLKCGHNWPSLSPQAQRQASLDCWKRRMKDPARRAIHLQKKRTWEKANRQNSPEDVKAYFRNYSLKIKKEVVAAYGGRCACCGESELSFLTIDHVHNNGAELRRNGEPFGEKLRLKLRKQGYPTDYQILCMNCNWAKGMYGECPHQAKKRDLHNSIIYLTQEAARI
jgi:hypothetical protein